MTWKRPLAYSTAAAALVCCGVFAHMWWSRPTMVEEQPVKETRQADGSLILERKPDPTVTAKQAVPKRSKLERVAQVTVQPDKGPAEPDKPCPPVTVDLSILREPDGGRRILASSPDGRVVAGLDIPVEPATLLHHPPRWAIGATYGPEVAGAWLQRHIEVFGIQTIVGVDLIQVRGDLATFARLGIAF